MVWMVGQQQVKGKQQQAVIVKIKSCIIQIGSYNINRKISQGEQDGLSKNGCARKSRQEQQKRI